MHRQVNLRQGLKYQTWLRGGTRIESVDLRILNLVFCEPDSLGLGLFGFAAAFRMGPWYNLRTQN